MNILLFFFFLLAVFLGYKIIYGFFDHRTSFDPPTSLECAEYLMDNYEIPFILQDIHPDLQSFQEISFLFSCSDLSSTEWIHRLIFFNANIFSVDFSTLSLVLSDPDHPGDIARIHCLLWEDTTQKELSYIKQLKSGDHIEFIGRITKVDRMSSSFSCDRVSIISINHCIVPAIVDEVQFLKAKRNRRSSPS